MKKYKRFFAFGCSFTHYKWATWANVIAHSLDCEFYNFGKSGGGNSYIANQITQADAVFDFNTDDLVIVCWTNISREDRFRGKTWITPGNIYTQAEYDTQFVKNWADETHFALRDYSYIRLIDNYLSKTNYHFISMCDLIQHVNQWENTEHNANKNTQDIASMYSSSLNKIEGNFYSVLWQNNIDKKWKKDWRTIHRCFSDGHPTPIEHCEFVKKIFPQYLSENTEHAATKLQQHWVEYIREGYKNSKKSHGIHEMPNEWQEFLFKKFSLTNSLPIPHQIFN